MFKIAMPHTRYLQATAIACSLGVLAACGSGPMGQTQSARQNNLPAVKLNELKLSTSVDAIAKSPDFAYFEAGHFGDKTQYNGTKADENGGAYAIHCRNGMPFGIEVKYQGDGIDRELAMKVMQRLLPQDAGEVVEHDDEDLQKMDAPQAAEFFYFKGGPRSDLLYAKDSNKKVVQINVFSKAG